MNIAILFNDKPTLAEINLQPVLILSEAAFSDYTILMFICMQTAQPRGIIIIIARARALHENDFYRLARNNSVLRAAQHASP